jgi:hypothetical protein
MKDRLSLHVDNGQSEIRESVTVLRNGGQASQSGLVGITNATYSSGGDPTLPQTILNVQSTGDSDIRFSSGPSRFFRSSIELLGNGNGRASGLHITYDPEFDHSYIAGGYGGYSDACVNPSGDNRTVVDFSLIRPSGDTGMEFSHISLSERGFVGVGLTRSNTTRHFDPHAPLTVAYMCDSIDDSGTISMHQQGLSPNNHNNFGKIYVKPFTLGGRSQAIFFKDDSGVETNLVLSEDLEPTIASGGLIYGNNGNTYGGWHTPKVRQADATKSNNTYYGWGAGYLLSETGSADCNTLVGYHAGSGMEPVSSNNTVVGCDSLVGYTDGNRNVIVGDSNFNGGSTEFGGMDDAILIGRELYQSEIPEDGTFALGKGSIPLLLGKITGSKYLSVVGGTFSVLEQSQTEFKTSFEFDNTFVRHTTVLDTIDYNRHGSDQGINDLEFRFSNSDGLSETLLTLDPRGSFSHTPIYQAPASTTPFAQLNADIKLKGAIRFQDGTSLSGISEFNLIPLNGVSGTNVIVQNNENYIVLDYSGLDLAGNIATEIRTDNTFIAAQVDGTASNKVGKISLQGLADYVSSGASTIAENCNVLISNPENELNVNTAGMSHSVLIGCDVAYGASGWKHSVIIGSEAGVNATVSNPNLGMDLAVVFLGHRAGYDCDNLDNTIGIGTNAAKNADAASDSVFIGSNAGLDGTYANSIGIGEHALRGTFSGGEGGSGNLEIVCGLDDNNRLMYSGGALSNRINIMNTIAGRTDIPNISIGMPRLSPEAPLEVRRHSSVHDSNPNDFVQSWFCDDVLVASMDCEGNLYAGSGNVANTIEGLMDTAITGGTMAVPASGRMSIYEDGTNTGDDIYITNRDSSMTGVLIGAFVVAIRIKTEYRPTWVGCP